MHSLVTQFFGSMSGYPLRDDFEGPPSVIIASTESKSNAKPKKERSVVTATQARKRRRGELPLPHTTADSNALQLFFPSVRMARLLLVIVKGRTSSAC